MSNYPESIDIFVDKTGADYVGSSDPNEAYTGIETTQGLIGGVGFPQSWSTTLLTLLRKYQNGLVPYVSSGVPTIRIGEIMLENTNGTKFSLRRNADEVSVGTINLDAGSVAATHYYLYAVAAYAATTAPIVFSTDPNAPSAIGTSPYAKIGWFKNTAVGAISATFAGGIGKAGESINGAFAVGATETTYAGAVSGTEWIDLPDMSVDFVSTGGTVEILFNMGVVENGGTAGGYGYVRITINGTEKNINIFNCPADGWAGGATVLWTEALAAGAYEIKAQWRSESSSYNFQNDGAVFRRVMSIKEY